MWIHADLLRFHLSVLIFFSLANEMLSVKLTAIRIPPYAKAGDSVTFKCEYDLAQVDLYSIKWYWNEEEFYRYVPKESPPFRSFSVKYINVDVSKSGENVVTLRGVQRQLTGNYKCEVSEDGPLFHTDILAAHMIVFEPPNERPIMKIESGKIEIGKSIIADCFVLPCDPPANITWFVNNIVIDAGIENIKLHPKHDEQDSFLNLWTSKSRIQIMLEKSHFVHGIMKIKCLASIYSAWNGTVEEELRDETPQLAQILDSTSFDGQTDLMIDSGHRRHEASVYLETVVLSFTFTCLLTTWR